MSDGNKDFAKPRTAVAYELVFALLAVGALTVGYACLPRGPSLQPSGLVGHSLGIVGFLMMLSTETLYSLRKRVPGFHLGPMSIWLQAHIFTGIVGSYLVVLHAGWKFNGLAGVLTLLTIMIVISGVVGRYIYTAVPRTLEGVALAVVELEEPIAAVDRELQAVGVPPEEMETLAAIMHPARGWVQVLARPIVRWRQRRQIRRWARALPPRLKIEGRAALTKFYQLVKTRHRLQMQLNSVDATRRLLALWHMFHVPLSGVLFTLAAIHIGAALYYATLLK
ncbi:hypothetical protein AYO44_10045 [Planctomycetaceae bacterium SCGC AG-212-F19]|nr:hypothetical protein AYO44_10045 [Planctomycetaceae bacterium SCGC AG-212-F19]